MFFFSSSFFFSLYFFYFLFKWLNIFVQFSLIHLRFYFKFLYKILCKNKGIWDVQEKEKNALETSWKKIKTWKVFSTQKLWILKMKQTRLSIRQKLKVRTNKKGKWCTLYRLWNTLRKEDENVAFEISECLYE